jgi:hypothetical protein
MALPTVKNPPPGVAVREVGDAETMAELFDGFAVAMQAGLLMVYGVLVLLFVSFLQPITILFSLPLSIGGAVLGLLAAGQPISMPVAIGILMLLGIVTKNAIMLVDFGLEAMGRGLSPAEAIVDAGRKRARPIVMTTVAMVAGMVPSALAFGVGGEAARPIAIAVIGGLLVSTVLSLVFVPAFFVLMNDLERHVRRLTRFHRPREDESRPAAANFLSGAYAASERDAWRAAVTPERSAPSIGRGQPGVGPVAGRNRLRQAVAAPGRRRPGRLTDRRPPSLTIRCARSFGRGDPGQAQRRLDLRPERRRDSSAGAPARSSAADTVTLAMVSRSRSIARWRRARRSSGR